MSQDIRNFLVYERQERLRQERSGDRLARATPRVREGGWRERMALLLISLALRIAPWLGRSRRTPLHVSVAISARTKML